MGSEMCIRDRLTMALAQEKCEIFSMQEHEESLETYYMNLIGGGQHE